MLKALCSLGIFSLALSGKKDLTAKRRQSFSQSFAKKTTGMRWNLQQLNIQFNFRL